jgi:hypothetical protein
MYGKVLGAIFVVLLISGCSLFVAEAPAEDKICVNKEKLSALLNDLGMTVQDLENAPEQSGTDVQMNPGENAEVVNQPAVNKTSETAPEAQAPAGSMAVRTYKEGDLVKLTPKASDAEGDKITFTYTSPLDENGEWQTGPGDAGEYVVTVTASDGKSTVSKQLKVVVVGANQPPSIEDISDMTVREGETITFTPVVSDPEGDDIAIKYTGFMNGPEYTTNYDDAGEYFVTITASDADSQTVKRVKITVLNKNRAPEVEDMAPVTATEGETIKLDASADDPDDDTLVITYSAPVGEDGVWETKSGDAGTYLITVTASDGELDASKTVTVQVLASNKKPVIEIDAEKLVNVEEGKTATVTLNPVVTDADGDNVQVSYSGWMTTNTKDVTVADKGEYQVVVSATDGKATVDKPVTVIVNAVPLFDFG